MIIKVDLKSMSYEDLSDLYKKVRSEINIRDAELDVSNLRRILTSNGNGCYKCVGEDNNQLCDVATRTYGECYDSDNEYIYILKEETNG